MKIITLAVLQKIGLLVSVYLLVFTLYIMLILTGSIDANSDDGLSNHFRSVVIKIIK